MPRQILTITNMWCDHFPVFELIMEFLRPLWVSELNYFFLFFFFTKKNRKSGCDDSDMQKTFSIDNVWNASQRDPYWERKWGQPKISAGGNVLVMMQPDTYSKWQIIIGPYSFLNQKRNLGHMELHYVGLNCMDFSQLLEHIALSCASLTSLLSPCTVRVFFFIFECFAMSKRILAFWSVLIN